MKAIVLILLLVFCMSSATTSANAQYRRPGVAISPAVTVKGSRIKLKDIAQIHPGEKDFAVLIEILAEVELGESPAPKTKTVILGAKVLEAITAAGIPLDGIAYSIPKAIAIERAGRVVGKDEVLQSVKDTLWKEKTLDLAVREVEWPMEQIIPTGITQIETAQLGEPSAGRLPLRVEVRVDDEPAARFLATALVDDWREVPVPVRQVDRGMLVSPADLQLVRINLLQQPADIVADYEQIVGRRAKMRLNPGETVRKNALDIPPVIPKGKKVSVLYKQGLLVATMNGVAMEDGFDRGEIRVRNESSRKIVIGSVVDANTVSVQ